MEEKHKYQLVKDTAAIISQDFDWPRFDEQIKANNKAAYEQLKKKLTRAIRELIDHDMERLLQVLYRIDVDEKRSDTILSTSPPPKIPEQLAKLVIERELQKAYTRQLYRDGKI